MVLSGGVGGARLARGFDSVLPPGSATVIVNVGDDETIYGVRVCADVDTVLYTLAGMEGPHGWGVAGDTFAIMDHLSSIGVDTRFRLGDRDLATCLARTGRLATGEPLSAVVADLASAMGIGTRVLPSTDDRVATRVETADGWLSFQEYFVLRGHRDEVESLDYGAGAAAPAPGVLEALAGADLVVIAPSNPPLSIWPILAVPSLRDAVVAARSRVPVVAVSPLFGGVALKGPADRVMAAVGLPPGNPGVALAYEGLIDHLVIDRGDEADAAKLASQGIEVHVADTRIAEADAADRFARRLLEALIA